LGPALRRARGGRRAAPPRPVPRGAPRARPPIPLAALACAAVRRHSPSDAPRRPSQAAMAAGMMNAPSERRAAGSSAPGLRSVHMPLCARAAARLCACLLTLGALCAEQSRSSRHADAAPCRAAQVATGTRSARGPRRRDLGPSHAPRVSVSSSRRCSLLAARAVLGAVVGGLPQPTPSAQRHSLIVFVPRASRIGGPPPIARHLRNIGEKRPGTILANAASEALVAAV